MEPIIPAKRGGSRLCAWWDALVLVAACRAGSSSFAVSGETPTATATSSGVSPLAFTLATSAPLSTKSLTTSSAWNKAAQCSSVHRNPLHE